METARAARTTIAPDELDLVVRQFNDTYVEYPHDRLIHELFEEQVEKSPDACAVICGDRRLSYGEINARADRLAWELIELGLKPESCVGVCAERGLEMIVGMLAVLKAGGAYVPLDPEYPADRLAFMCKDSSPAAILTTSDLKNVVAGQELPIVLLDGTSSQARKQVRRPALSSRNLAYVIYTSGSSGLPKGVMIEHRSVVRLVVNARYAELHAGDCVAHCASPSFDAATWEIWGALLNGASVLVVPQSELLNARLFDEQLIRHRVTAMFLTVGLFHRYVDELEEAFSGLRYLLVGGDVVVPSIAMRALDRAAGPKHLLNAYGPSETTTFATTFEVTREAASADALPIGRPITNTRAYVLDENRTPLPVGNVGEIYIGGPGVARGYLNRPELTHERFVEDSFGSPGEKLYRTGDIGRWRADGTLEFLGRTDFQVKIRGFRVEPGEIETALQRHPSVKQALVMAREDAPGDKRLVAYVVLRSQQPPAGWPDDPPSDLSNSTGAILAELRDALTQLLPQYMVPAAFVLMEELPLSPNGKVDRAALPAPHEQQWRRVGYAPPQSPLEKSLTELWMARLKQERIGLDDNFFELGGDSMMGLELVADVGDRLGARGLSVIAVFECPTVREMAQFLETTVLEAAQANPGSP